MADAKDKVAFEYRVSITAFSGSKRVTPTFLSELIHLALMDEDAHPDIDPISVEVTTL